MEEKPEASAAMLAPRKSPSEVENSIQSQVLVAYACNPSYSGGRDKEDCGLQPAQANSS
jgi:hypothetical protein